MEISVSVLIAVFAPILSFVAAWVTMKTKIATMAGELKAQKEQFEKDISRIEEDHKTHKTNIQENFKILFGQIKGMSENISYIKGHIEK